MAASPARQIGMRSIRTHELPAAIVAAQWLAGSGHGAWLAIASPTTTTNSPSIRTQSYPPPPSCVHSHDAQSSAADPGLSFRSGQSRAVSGRSGVRSFP